MNVNAYDINGKYLYSKTPTLISNNPDIPPAPPNETHPDEIGTYTGTVDIFNQYHDIENNKPVDIPPKPFDYSIFDYTTKQWVDPRTPDTEWPLVRAKRDQLLAQSDWTQLPDVPLTTKAEWATYRQALRDITNQTDPFNITWPTPPQ